MSCQRHATCKYLASHNAAFSAMIVPFNYYYGKDLVALVGKETGGAYAGQFNLIGGKGDPQDNGCWLKILIRELQEEAKITISWKEFDAHFRHQTTNFIRVIIHQRTPIFLGHFQGLSRTPLNKKISRVLADPTVPHHLKEMSEVQWVKLANKRRPDGKGIQLSSFADGVLTKIDPTRL